MGKKAGLVVCRGRDTMLVHNAEWAQQLLFAGSTVDIKQVDSCISNVAKLVLDRLEKADGHTSNGISMALGKVKYRFSELDKPLIKKIRSLGEAASLVRHLTELGVEKFVAQVETALGQLKPPRENNATGDDSKPRPEANADENMDVPSGRRRRRRRGRGAKSTVEEEAPSELNDEWADTAPRAIAVASAPFAGVAAPSGAVASSGRTLRARRSGSRTPPKSAGELAVGQKVVCERLEGRPELNGKVGVVKEYVSSSRRWGVRFDTGVEVAVRAENLRPSIFS
jgi:hypothetical protein